MSETARMEFDVEVFGSGCSTKIEQSLKAVPGVAEVHIDGGSSPKVIVDAAVPSEQIKSVIESTGRRAVLMGYGTSKGTNLGAAVAMLSSSSSSIQGITRFVQVSESVCVVDATIDGLASNERHGLFVHEYGDLSGGCESTGPVLEFPQGHPSLSPGTMQNGCLGDATADSNGRLSFRADVERVKVGDIIGRSLVVHGPREKGGGLWERNRSTGTAIANIMEGVSFSVALIISVISTLLFTKPVYSVIHDPVNPHQNYYGSNVSPFSYYYLRNWADMPQSQEHSRMWSSGDQTDTITQKNELLQRNENNMDYLRRLQQQNGPGRLRLDSLGALHQDDLVRRQQLQDNLERLQQDDLERLQQDDLERLQQEDLVRLHQVDMAQQQQEAEDWRQQRIDQSKFSGRLARTDLDLGLESLGEAFTDEELERVEEFLLRKTKQDTSDKTYKSGQDNPAFTGPNLKWAGTPDKKDQWIRNQGMHLNRVPIDSDREPYSNDDSDKGEISGGNNYASSLYDGSDDGSLEDNTEDTDNEDSLNESKNEDDALSSTPASDEDSADSEKTDAIPLSHMPFYCHPPNPCPKGYQPKDAVGGCIKEMPDTAQFNRQWVLRQMSQGECTCDRENMKEETCASVAAARHNQGQSEQVTNQHKSMTFKKGLPYQAHEEGPFRLTPKMYNSKANPVLMGVKLPVEGKKSPPML